MGRLVPQVRVANDVQIRPVLVVLGFRVRAERQQQLGHLGLAERRGLVQARVSRSGFLGVHANTLRVRVAGGLDVLAHGINIAGLECEDQCSLLCGVVRHRAVRRRPE